MSDIPVLDKHGRTVRGLVGRLSGGNCSPCRACDFAIPSEHSRITVCNSMEDALGLEKCTTMSMSHGYHCTDAGIAVRVRDLKAATLAQITTGAQIRGARQALRREVK